MKRLYIVETTDGLWKYRKNARIRADGMVKLWGGFYQPDPSRCRFRQYRSIFLFKRTVQIFPFRQGDPETVPHFAEFADDDGTKKVLPYPRHSTDIIQSAMLSHKASLLLRRSTEINLWQWLAVILGLAIIMLAAALYSAHAPR